eukprot:1268221-Prymnesium_polylepis.1
MGPAADERKKAHAEDSSDGGERKEERRIVCEAELDDDEPSAGAAYCTQATHHEQPHHVLGTQALDWCKAQEERDHRRSHGGTPQAEAGSCQIERQLRHDECRLVRAIAPPLGCAVGYGGGVGTEQRKTGQLEADAGGRHPKIADVVGQGCAERRRDDLNPELRRDQQAGEPLGSTDHRIGVAAVHRAAPSRFTRLDRRRFGARVACPIKVEERRVGDDADCDVHTKDADDDHSS